MIINILYLFLLSAVIALLAIALLYSRAQNRQRYSYQSVLRKYSQALIHPMPDLDRFSKLAPYLLYKSMKLAGASVMILDRENKRYVIRAGAGTDEELVGQSLAEDSPLIQELIKNGKEINLETIKDRLKNQLPPEGENHLQAIRQELGQLKSVLVIPSISESDYFSQPTLVATINLGPKLSGQRYTKDDIEFLETMGNQASISVEYAFILEELKKQQAQVLKSEKLAAIGSTTAGVAHELKNPLTFLLTIAQAMPASWDNPNFKESVIQMFPAEVERMRLIIEGLSDYSKTKALKLEPVEITAILEKVTAILAFEIRKAKVEVKKIYPPVSDQAVALADKNRLVQVFMNVIANAVQAMDLNAGRNPDKAGLLTITVTRDDKTVSVSVTDTGPGIPRNQLDKIFDPFFTTKDSGTGLGLSITKKIVDEHKGSISINSLTGVGTTFTVTLPRSA